MDIDILLALQEFRNGSGAFLDSFFFKDDLAWGIEHGDCHHGIDLLVYQQGHSPGAACRPGLPRAARGIQS